MKRSILILLLFSSISLSANQILTNQFVAELVNFKPIDYRFPSMDNRGILFYGTIAQEIIDTLNTDPAGKLTKKQELYVVNMVAAGQICWGKFKAFYGFVGCTAFKHKWNWKDMRDTDDAFRLKFYGDVGHSCNGINGFPPTVGYADTHVNAKNDLYLNNLSIGYYKYNTSIGDYRDMGTSLNNLLGRIYISGSFNPTWVVSNAGNETSGLNGGLISMYSLNLKNNRAIISTNRGFIFNKNYTMSELEDNTILLLGVRNSFNNVGSSSSVISFSYISEGLTDIELSSLLQNIKSAQNLRL